MLLLVQLAAVLAYPYFTGSRAGQAAIGVVGIVVLVTAIGAVQRSPALTWVAVLLGGPAVVLTVVDAFWPSDAITLTSALVHAPFYFYVSFAMIRSLFADAKVTHDELFAVGAAFTVVAWAFAYLYVAVQIVWPGSFTPTDHTHTWFELLFLSFTTLTNTGLSDLTPVIAQARSVVMLEQVSGVMYIALVIARLVALTTGRRD